MNRFTRWLAVGLLAVGGLTGCTDDQQKSSTLVGPEFITVPAAGWDLVDNDTLDINGALWVSGLGFKVGTGVIDPFLGIQAKDQQEGFNTDGKFNYDQTRSNFTDALPLNNIPVIHEEITFGDYKNSLWREIILDANEADSPPAAQFSIDEFELYLCHDAGAGTFEDYEQFAENGDCELVYEIDDPDTPTKETGWATDGKTSGSGNSLDYYILVPDRVFQDFVEEKEISGCEFNPLAPDCGVFVILWNKMGFYGGDWVVGSTFEEYSTIVRPFIMVSKDATPSVDKEHYWDLTKVADATSCSAFPDEECDSPFGYTVEAVYEGNSLVNYEVMGTIYLDNPSEEDVVINSVTDAIDGEPIDAVCGVEFPYTLPSGGHLECTYTLSLDPEDVPSGTLTNTATVTFETTDGLGLGPRTATADFTFDDLMPTRERSCNVNVPTTCTEWGTTDVNVIDDYATDVEDFLPDGCNEEIGCVGNWTAGPETTETITYSRTGFCEADEGGDTKTYTNTAQIKELVLSASATVTVNCLELASKAGDKFHDLNANGSRDSGEPGLPDWTIYLKGTDVDGAAVSLSTATDENGHYLFDDLKPGNYMVTEDMPTGWTCSFPNAGSGDADGVTGAVTSSNCQYDIELASGEDETGNNFGNWQTASKTGMKFEDANANGLKDGSEAGLSGWVIYVDYNDDGVLDTGEPSATTAADGTYTISGIDPGTWKVKEVAQEGWMCSYPNAGLGDANATTGAVTSTACYHEETFVSGVTETGNDFGNWQTASKSGKKFHDLNANGAEDGGEPGLADWVIYVDYNNDGVPDTDEPSATTAADGTYTIDGIAPGTWKVKEVAQLDWTCSYPNAGGGDADPVTGAITSSACFHQETFVSGVTETENKFGNWTTATKSGLKYHDLNANGTNDGEPGLADWVIYVDYNDDGVLDTGEPNATTAADGTYTISGIDPGTWKVKEVGKADWFCSDPDPCYHQETFDSDEDETDNDFGNYQYAAKSGYKFHDQDADGVWDAGEPGLNNWTIFVDSNGNGSLDTGEPFTTTVDDAGGNPGYYEFSLEPGTYTFQEVLKTDWYQSAPAAPGTITETLESQEISEDNNFGNYQYATKSGYKFHDQDADGVWDAGEPGLNNWTIFVDSNGNGSLDTGEPFTTTVDDAGANPGYYEFSLEPGTYTFQEVLKTDWYQSAPAAPGTITETLESQEISEDNNFGNYQYASKSGQKFYDENNNNLWDSGEAYLNDWTINLLQGGSVIASTPTATVGATMGYYEFTGLMPGVEYQVCEVQQIDWIQTYPTSGPPCADGTLGYTFTLQSQQAETGNDFGNYMPMNEETAFALGDGDTNTGTTPSMCFIPEFGNWGWTNGSISQPAEGDSDFSQTWEVWAGAGQCDINKGEPAGHVTITYASDGTFSWYLDLNEGFSLVSEHVYAGSTEFPMVDGSPTVSPGQYYIEENLSGDIYVIYHAVVEY